MDGCDSASHEEKENESRGGALSEQKSDSAWWRKARVTMAMAMARDADFTEKETGEVRQVQRQRATGQMRAGKRLHNISRPAWQSRLPGRGSSTRRMKSRRMATTLI